MYRENSSRVKESEPAPLAIEQHREEKPNAAMKTRGKLFYVIPPLPNMHNNVPVLLKGKLLTHFAHTHTHPVSALLHTVPIGRIMYRGVSSEKANTLSHSQAPFFEYIER